LKKNCLRTSAIMGNCLEPKSSPSTSDNLTATEQKAHHGIQTGLIDAAQNERKAKKLLLLGAGSSGKSTLFKQLKCIHGWGFENPDFVESKHNIRVNMVACMIKLLTQSEGLYKQQIIEECVDLDDEKTMTAIKCVASFKEEQFELEEEVDWNAMEKLGGSLDLLWQLTAIQQTFSKGRRLFAIPENMDYFFKKARQIFAEDFFPSNQDVLRTRIRTTGAAIEANYEINGVFFRIFDAGGQRNERRKWIHQFENVTALMFVAALNHYNCVLFEDEQKNAMLESLALFDEIINTKWFKSTEIILFLNKKDLFAELIREGVSLSVCFHAKHGWHEKEWQWLDNENPNDYATYSVNQPMVDHDEAAQNQQHSVFEKCYKAALEFITDVYLSRNRNKNKRVFVHVTDATDRDQIEKVFWDVQEIVVRSNLKRNGFV